MNRGVGDSYPFVYSTNVEVSARGQWGNYTPRLPARGGQRFAMTRTPICNELVLDANSSATRSIEIVNNLNHEVIAALVYRSGKLAACTADIVPGQKAVFEFQPTIFIGIVPFSGGIPQVYEGETMNLAILSQINTELSLLGISRADIVMTGGGAGPQAVPFQFSLQNIVMT
jgi:hypothetical protein